MLSKAKNHLLFLGNLIKGRFLSKKIPLVVFLNVTNRCNIKCTYCYGDYYNRKERDFSAEELLGLIDDFAAMGTRSIYLSGGEPLLRKDIGAVINAVKNKGMLCFINTNGILLPEKIEEVRNVDALTISLDGDQEVNDKNRGEGSFEKTIKGIDAAYKSGIKFALNTVVSKDSLNSIDYILKLAEEYGCTAEFNLPYQQSMGNIENDTVSLSDEEIKINLQRLIQKKKEGAPITFSRQTREYALSWPLSYYEKVLYKGIEGFKELSCYAGQFMCMIDSDGKVYPCGQLIGDFPELDVREKGFRKCWEELSELKTCKSCYSLCFNEFNFLFDLNPNVIFASLLRFINKR
ncbi:MAG: radical SAM protein [Nitrospinae bacterium]|nr:radical SAM protein [Nitrospinota bacterium]